MLDETRLVGVLDRETLIRALSVGGQEQLVSAVMRRDVQPIDLHEMVEQALARLDESKSKTLPVTHAGQLAGLLTSDNITELLMIRSALRARPGTS